MRLTISFMFCLLLAPALASAAAAVAIGGGTGSGGGSCIGTYTATVKFASCSNSIALSDSFQMNGMGAPQPGTLQGGVNFSRFVFSEHHFANGSCAIMPGSSTSLGLALEASLNGTSANFTMKAVNNAQLSGSFSQSSPGKLSGSFSGDVWGPQIQGTFDCLLQDAPTTGSAPLAVTRSGTGGGKVVSVPAGIDCGLTCGTSVAKGTSLTLTATPEPGSYFAGWSGACSGKSSCSVTINEATGVKASFMAIPFAVSNSGSVTASSVSLNTAITFKASDIGKRGSVFVTARIPRAALLKALQPTGSIKSPVQARDATESSSTVLIQQTTSGWEMIVDGQLVPYASGVLGETVAAQTILYTTDTGTLEGAEFCVGYGTSAAEMVASGNMVPVASVPATDTSGTTTESCVIAGSSTAAVMPFTGLWWNPDESGWGMSITQQGSTIFVAWYTYDQAGNPEWYVMSSCPVIGSGCSGEIYRVTGGTSLLVPWDGAAKVVLQTGTGSLAFTDNDHAVLTYTLNGVSGQKSITRQMFASGTAQPTIDYSSLWWNPNESGWGVSITQQYATIFAAIFSYDASGAPYWYVASNCPMVGSGCTGELYKVTGGMPPSVPWNGAGKVVSKVGTLGITFSDDSNGTMNFTIDGVSASRAITKQLF